MNKSLFLTSALALVCALAASGAVDAQTWTSQSKLINPTFDVQAAQINSGTTLAQAAVKDKSGKVSVYLSATTLVSVSLQTMTKNGIVLASETIAVGGAGDPVSRTFGAQVPFEAIKLSPTTALSGVNAVHANIINYK